MKIFELDASRWETVGEALEALLVAIEAPDWHGRNLNALRDSVMGNDLNGVRAPFVIRVTGKLSEEVRVSLGVVGEIFEEARQYGVDVHLSLPASDGLGNPNDNDHGN